MYGYALVHGWLEGVLDVVDGGIDVGGRGRGADCLLAPRYSVVFARGLILHTVGRVATPVCSHHRIRALAVVRWISSFVLASEYCSQ